MAKVTIMALLLYVSSFLLLGFLVTAEYAEDTENIRGLQQNYYDTFEGLQRSFTLPITAAAPVAVPVAEPTIIKIKPVVIRYPERPHTQPYPYPYPPYPPPYYPPPYQYPQNNHQSHHHHHHNHHNHHDHHDHHDHGGHSGRPITYRPTYVYNTDNDYYPNRYPIIQYPYPYPVPYPYPGGNGGGNGGGGGGGNGGNVGGSNYPSVIFINPTNYGPVDNNNVISGRNVNHSGTSPVEIIDAAVPLAYDRNSYFDANLEESDSRMEYQRNFEDAQDYDANTPVNVEPYFVTDRDIVDNVGVQSRNAPVSLLEQVLRRSNPYRIGPMPRVRESVAALYFRNYDALKK